MTATGSSIDINEILLRINGDRIRLIELLNISLSEFPKWKTAFESAIAIKDFNRLGKLAHTYKGSCATLGMNNARVIFFEIEQRAREENLLLIETLFSNAWSEVNNSVISIKKYIEINSRLA